MSGKVTTTGGLDRLMADSVVDEGVGASFRPLLVIGFCYFKSPLDVNQTRRQLKDKFMAISRMHSLMEKPAKKEGPATWREVDKESINMADLVQVNDEVKTQEQLDAFCTKMYGTDLGLELPRWRAFVFNNMADGRSMLCFCIDHAIGDGPSLVGALMKSLDDMPDMPGVGSGKRKIKPAGCFAKISACLGGTCHAFCGDQMPADQPNKLKIKDHRNPGGNKSICQTTPIAMDKLKEVATQWGGATINDVLMVVVSLTLRQYFQKEEPKTLNNKKLRANFPISMRPASANVTDDKWFGNQFSQGQLQFPIHLDDPQAVFAHLKKQMDKIKISPEPLIRQKLVAGVANSKCLPLLKKKDIILDAYGMVTAMLSNIPGPNKAVKFAGQEMDEMSFYAFAPIGLYFGIVSYKGTFRAGICADATCEPDPKKLAAEWTTAWEKVYSNAMGKA